MYACVCAQHAYTNKGAGIDICILVCEFTYTHACIYASTPVHTYTHTHIHTYTHTHIHMYIALGVQKGPLSTPPGGA